MYDDEEQDSSGDIVRVGSILLKCRECLRKTWIEVDR